MELGSSSKGHKNFRGLFMKKGGWDLPNKFFLFSKKNKKVNSDKETFSAHFPQKCDAYRSRRFE